MTTRTEQAATRRGWPGQWTYDDAALARLEANATARPRGLYGPCPDELWAGRQPIADSERSAFREAVNRYRAAIATAGERAPGGASPEMQARAIDRQAIGRALVEHGHLRYARRPIHPPIAAPEPAGIM